MSGPAVSAMAQARTGTLGELRVFELKQELEKRGLDKNGIKFALIERLETALREEGHDPKTYLFSVGDYGKSSSAVKTVKKSVVDEEAPDNADDEKESEDGEKGQFKQGTEASEKAATDEAVANIEKEDEEGMDGEIEDKSSKLIVDETPVTVNDRDVEENKEETAECEFGYELAETDIKKESHEVSLKEVVKKEDLEKVEAKETPSKQQREPTTNSAVETAISTPPAIVEKSSNSHSQATSKKPADNSLWIKGIGPNTKAADLKALFSKYGRVLTAKIFTRRQQPSSACFGFVTMVDSATADLCIHKLHKSTVKGRVITVERADRSNMPVVKSITKKVTSPAGTAQKSSSNTTSAERPKSEERPKSSRELSSEKEKKEKSSSGKTKSAAVVEKVSSHMAGSEKQKAVKAANSSNGSKKVPIRAPSTGTSHKNKPIRERVQISRVPPRFRAGRRILDRPERFTAARRPFAGAIRKPAFALRRPGGPPGRIPLSGRPGRMGRFARREVSSRRVEPLTAWDRREMMEMLRKKEEEHRLKEQELKLQRERERLKFERERFERERLELQQLRQLGQFAAPQIPAVMSPSRRSHESYDDIHSSSRHRDDYSRSSGDRHSGAHRNSSGSSRMVASDRRESRGSSRHVSSSHHSSSRGLSERERSRHSGRERESRDYVSPSTREIFSRDSHSTFSRSLDAPVGSYGKDGSLEKAIRTLGKDAYRGTDVSYGNSHRSSDIGYSSRDLGYSSGGGYASSSRSGGGATSWSVGGSTSNYVSSSSRDYDAGSPWLSSITPTQSHGVSGGQWQSSRTVDNWSSGDGYGQQGSHGSSSYDKSYDKYDSYDKYGRRY